MTCARCLVLFTTPADHAAHLIADHAVTAMAALREARVGDDAHPPIVTAKEPPMPSTAGQTGATWTCGACGETGHTARSCQSPRRAAAGDKKCGYCKRAPGVHSATCPRRDGAKARTGKAKTGNGASPRARMGIRPVPMALAPTNGSDPFAAIRAALLQIEAELTGMRDLKAAMAKALGA
jgi:hypothetical protein